MLLCADISAWSLSPADTEDQSLNLLFSLLSCPFSGAFGLSADGLPSHFAWLSVTVRQGNPSAYPVGAHSPLHLGPGHPNPPAGMMPALWSQPCYPNPGPALAQAWPPQQLWSLCFLPPILPVSCSLQAPTTVLVRNPNALPELPGSPGPAA